MSEIRRSSRSTKGRNSRLEREAASELANEGQARKKRKTSKDPSPPKTGGRTTKKSRDTNKSSGQDTSSINCVCGMTEFDEDDDRIMAECENCLKWQHVACMFGVEDASAVPDGYLCHECQKTATTKNKESPEKTPEQKTTKQTQEQTIQSLEQTNKVRGSVAKALYGIFVNQAYPEAVKRGDLQLSEPEINDKSQRLALDIEQALFDALAAKKQKDVGPKYREKFRSLSFNLKDEKNPDLRKRVVNGELAPDHIVELSTEEMLNPELQKLKENVRKESIRETVLKPDDMPRVKRTHKGEEMVEGEEKYQEEQFFGVMGHENDRNREERERERSRSRSHSRSRSMSPFQDHTISNRSASDSKSPTSSVSTTTVKRDPWDTADDILASPQHDDDQEEQGLESHNVSDDEFADIIGSSDNDTKNGSTVPPVKVEARSPSFNPWAGQLTMPEIATIQASSFHFNSLGTNVSPDQLWPAIVPPQEHLVVEGRLDSRRAIEYLYSVRASRDIITMVILPQPVSVEEYSTLFAYFHARGKFGVIHHDLPAVKDSYLIPISRLDPVPDYLGLSPTQSESLKQMTAQREILLAAYVVNKGISVPSVFSSSSSSSPVAQSTLQGLGLSTADLERLRSLLAANPQVANNPQLAQNPQLLVSLLEGSTLSIPASYNRK